MKTSCIAWLLICTLLAQGARSAEPAPKAAADKTAEPKPIAPPISTNTGLLLEPPLDLSWFTHEKFVAEISNVGPEKIHKPWTSPVVKLPPHKRADAKGLTEEEVKEYMRLAKQMFDDGNAIPVSDVGLISTQEDVIRQPMLNHIAAFENEAARVYLLVQRTASDTGWSYFSIVQDMTLDPLLDYFAQIHPNRVQFEATSCYKCHSSGPLAIHPAREDLVLDAKLAAALSARIAEQPRSVMFFPKESPRPESGEPIAVSACAGCHYAEGDRNTLYQLHSHSIRVLVDFGYMPPDERLSKEEITELKEWLDSSNVK